MLFALYSPNGTYDAHFLANYAYINLNDQLTRVPGIASVTVFGAGQYAMRLWVKPDQLAKLQHHRPGDHRAPSRSRTPSTRPARSAASRSRRARSSPTRSAPRAAWSTAEEFGEIVVRANPDGSIVRLKDVARIELGAQTYNISGRLNGKPAAVIAVYQLPGSNAIEAADGAKKLMEELKKRFPPDLDYAVALDTTLAVTEGINEIVHTLLEALVLVILVVFIFLQGWRATLIPLLAVPVSLVGTFVVFPLLRLLHQHAVALRPGAGHRPGGGRRHRRGRGGGAPHRAGAVAQGGDASRPWRRSPARSSPSP